eukprot:9894307-Alexandrium_andersonii.AAC.1
MEKAAKGIVVQTETRKRKPWIATDTLQLIEERGKLTRRGKYHDAEALDKSIRKSAKRDKRQWFSEKFTTSVWDPVKLLGKDRATK